MTEKNYEELFIFKRMVEGDKAAFHFFFEKYYADLCNLINFYVRDPVISEEIAQDIFIGFWEKREDIKINASVKAYLFKACKNKSLNYLRNEKRKLNIHEKLAKVAETNYDELPGSNMDANYLREIINKSVNSLPEKCREIFILAKEENLTYKEIANRLGLSVKTVENQMGKALKLLRELLRPYYNELFE